MTIYDIFSSCSFVFFKCFDLGSNQESNLFDCLTWLDFRPIRNFLIPIVLAYILHIISYSNNTFIFVKHYFGGYSKIFYLHLCKLFVLLSFQKQFGYLDNKMGYGRKQNHKLLSYLFKSLLKLLVGENKPLSIYWSCL